MTTPAIRSGSGRLLLTDYWYLAATAIAAAVVVDPLEWGLAAQPLVKHLALALSLPAVALAFVGARLRAPRQEAGRTARLALMLCPLLLLAVLVLGGGLHARFVQGIQNTFLNVGLYMLVTYCAAAMVLKSEAPEALVRGHVRILLAAAVVMAAFLIVNFGVRQVYHEPIFLVIPMAVLFFARARGAVLRWAGCVFFLAMAWLSAKYTSYIIAALTVAYLALAVTVPRLAPRPGLQRVMMIYWTFLLAGVVTAFFAYLGLRGVLELPTGNVDYRMHTYTLAWDRFGDSPLWGTLFAVEAVEKFTLYSTGIADNMLATHSDVLDLLANGGLLAFVLWIWALARVARVVYPGLLAPQRLDQSWAPYAHALAVMSVAGVVTYAFNPILLQPALAYLVWTNLGMLAGLALRMGFADAQDGGLPHPAAGARARPPRGDYGIAGAGIHARSRN